jgi:competence protein ComEC
MAKMRKRTKRKINKAIFSIIMVLILAIAGYFVKDELPDSLTPTLPSGGPVSGQLEVHYIDVGQGDSIFLACGGKYMLIDAGNNDGDDRVVHYLQNLGIDELDLVVATHGDSDHIAEMDDVLNVIPAIDVWYPNYGHGTKTEERFLTAANNCGANLYRPELGSSYSLGEATVTVLGPVKDYDSANDMSLVLLVQFGDNRFLFTGDMENIDGAENDLVAYWGDDALKADVLKVGHHGSSTSTSYHFLRAVSPAYAVISVGEGNEYGHPKQEILNILGQAEVETYRTDEMGSIVATSDGEVITFRWEKTDAAPSIPEVKK